MKTISLKNFVLAKTILGLMLWTTGILLTLHWYGWKLVVILFILIWANNIGIPEGDE